MSVHNVFHEWMYAFGCVWVYMLACTLLHVPGHRTCVKFHIFPASKSHMYVQYEFVCVCNKLLLKKLYFNGLSIPSSPIRDAGVLFDPRPSRPISAAPIPEIKVCAAAKLLNLHHFTTLFSCYYQPLTTPHTPARKSILSLRVWWWWGGGGLPSTPVCFQSKTLYHWPPLLSLSLHTHTQTHTDTHTQSPLNYKHPCSLPLLQLFKHSHTLTPASLKQSVANTFVCGQLHGVQSEMCVLWTQGTHTHTHTHTHIDRHTDTHADKLNEDMVNVKP